jgi:hypothetical protein
MEQVVYLLEIFKAIFYCRFLELRKVPFGLVEVWKILNVFEPFKFGNGLNCFDPASRDCSRAHLSAPAPPLSHASCAA